MGVVGRQETTPFDPQGVLPSPGVSALAQPNSTQSRGAFAASIICRSLCQAAVIRSRNLGLPIK